MVQSCVAYGCTERYSKGCEVGFFRFPINENRRKLWVRAMKRENWEPSSSSRICGKHFQTGKPHLNPEHPDFVPTVFSFSKPITSVKSFERRKECRKKMHGTNLLTTATKPKVSAAACEPEEENFEEISDNVQLTPAETEIAKLKKLNAQMSLEVTALRIERDLWKGKAKLYSEEILSSNEKLLFYTTLESAVFNWIISIIRADIEGKIIIVPIETQLLIILIKLKLNLRSEDLAYRFQVSRRTIARIFDLWIPLLASRLSSPIRWPDKSSFRKHLPSCFKNSIFHDTKAIIDCTEVFVQKAGNQTARSHTWSNYKHHHTIKFLVAVTPNGHISFVSKVFGGRASDKEITLQSGFLEILEPGDVVLADKGFILPDDFARKGIKLVIPSFLRSKKQLTLPEVIHSKHVSNVRIHVERVIRMIKRFDVLHSIIPITFLKYIDSVIILCAALSNLSIPIVQ